MELCGWRVGERDWSFFTVVSGKLTGPMCFCTNVQSNLYHRNLIIKQSKVMLLWMEAVNGEEEK